MEVRRLFTYIIPTVILSMLFCVFSVASPLSCAAHTSNTSLVGGSCSIERATTPTLWSFQTDHFAVQTKEFFALLIVSIVLGFLHVFRKPEKNVHFRTSWKQYLSLWIYSVGPRLRKIFIPPLHAAHGW